MRILKFTSIAIITLVIIFGIGLPIVENPQNWMEYPKIPGLDEKFRNLFFHVPMSWVATIAFIVSTFYSLKYLNSKNNLYDIKAESSASLGLLFSLLATITGSMWAKFNWGSFWNWDPRQLSIIFLLLIYFAYFLLRASIKNEVSRNNISAVYNVIAGLSAIFFIFILPRMLAGLHPGSKGEADAGPILGGSGSKNVLFTFYFSLLGFTLFYIWLQNLSYRTRKLLKENYHA
ncbi:MAG: cytochrome c biogenesis protein CcsA [Bacteroidetes bacterium]|nr:cytochrome c biogenesis protein CcsA [Bacteroidota bacterium]